MSDLQHHGIKGQKWGVRRFQNSDGSLTDAGVKRYSNAIKRVETTKQIIDTTKQMVDTTTRQSGANRNTKTEKRIRSSVRDMSDSELQKRVQRLNMEDNYTRMMMRREELERGENYVSNALGVGSVALQGAVSALTIALLVKQLKG